MIRIAPQKEKNAVVPVPRAFVERFLPRAPETALRVYLYGLMLHQDGTDDFDLAGALGLSEPDVLEAFRYWQGQGLVSILPGDPPLVRFAAVGADAAPSSAQVRHAGFYAKLQSVLGSRKLSDMELARIEDWLDVFHMEEDAAVLLVAHCVEISRSKNHVSITVLDDNAKRWADAGILTLAAAEEHLARAKEKRGGASEILRRFNKNRPPTLDEEALYQAWLDAGFDAETILTACAGLTAYGTPSFRALDSILQNCRRNGVTAKAAMEEYQRAEEQNRAFAMMLYDRMGLKGAPSLAVREEIEMWRGVRHISDEIIFYAADQSLGQSKPFAYCRRLLEGWYKEGIVSLQDARASRAREQTAQKAVNNKKALNYLRREKPVDAAAFVISLDDDV